MDALIGVESLEEEMISSSSLSNEEFGVGNSFVAMELCIPFGILLFANHKDQDYVVDGFAQNVQYEQMKMYFLYLIDHTN